MAAAARLGAHAEALDVSWSASLWAHLEPVEAGSYRASGGVGLMARQKMIVSQNSDPFPYSGLLRRIDGVAPYNHYLWPLEADRYVARHDLDYCMDSRWRFDCVALEDGRWLADGFVRKDEAEMRFFATREAALRASAAEMLRTARNARSWGGQYRLSNEDFVAIVKWVRRILNLPERAVPTYKEPERPAHWEDLPLFARAV